MRTAHAHPTSGSAATAHHHYLLHSGVHAESHAGRDDGAVYRVRGTAIAKGEKDYLDRLLEI